MKFHIEGQHTTQPLYVCDKVNRLYLSKQGCFEMNILPKCYPKPMVPIPETNHLPTEAPKQRPAPPTKPTQLPFPGTPENIAKLETYIQDKLAETAFNNSAPFPSLTGQPAKIHLKPGGIPYAWHSPMPIPHHWKAKVNESLDHDVEQGIVILVPIGTPVKWCSPIVVASKEDGFLRRTIKFQRLNAQCHRETLHLHTISTCFTSTKHKEVNH